MFRVAVRLQHVLLFVPIALLLHADEATPPPTTPSVAPASPDAEQALQGFKIPSGMTGALFAAEPLIANPVAFYVDHNGRVFVCESFRQDVGVTDNRKHDEAWLDDDLAAQTVEDRLAYHKKRLPDNGIEYTKFDDRVRLVEDTDGDGKADRATVFANRFNKIEEGTGAGVIEHDGNVYYTCIPNLWRLRDTDGDGVADQRASMHNGFGVRVAFRGHDMHGLIVGPDGRLYFSIGDRGYNVVTDDGRLKDPESGAVFRCEMDGSNLEVVATGLRNPQELAFDDYGNLFTGDNNSDSGDQARWVYVVEGGDTGWRMSYQYLPDRGPFNREAIWHPFHEGQPAYIVPPVTNVADGPSGLAYYPGTGLGDEQRGRFFLCDFRGGSANSGVRSFRVKRKGAFFDLVDEEQPFWNILATDIQFGPAGGVFLSDWVDGWNGEGKGRLYHFTSAAAQMSPIVCEVKELLASDMSQFKTERLQQLLGHVDQRVRQASQFALAKRNAIDALTRTALDDDRSLARLHGIWGLGQIGRADSTARDQIAAIGIDLLDDDDVEVRSQAAKLLGDLRVDSAATQLTARMTDPDERVRYFAASSIGKLGASSALAAVVTMLEESADLDPVLRHGGIMALVGIGDVDELVSLRLHHSRSVRLAAVVALRRLASPQIVSYLKDTDPLVVIESARAIHDLPIPEAMPALASLIDSMSNDDALLRRVLNANFRLGQPQHAAALAAFAARSDGTVTLQVEALDMLATWESPSNRDRVLGMWRPLSNRDREVAVAALLPKLGAMLSGSNDVRVKATQVASQFGLPEAGPALLELFADAKQPAKVRADAIHGLGKLKAVETPGAIQSALTDSEPLVRAAARTALASIDPEAAVAPLQVALSAETTIERQEAAAALATIESDTAMQVLVTAVEKLIAGEIPADTQLDILEAAQARSTGRIAELLAKYDASRSADDPLANYREAMFGGDAGRGAQIFYVRTDLSCARCHRIDDSGGRVGPDLSSIALDKKRDYLLEAVVAPNRAIAKGFESVMIADAEGQIHVGILKEETDDAVTIMTADGKLMMIEQDEIEARRPGQSPMPEDIIKRLTKRDLRDLVEFLAQRKSPPKAEDKHE